MSVLEDFLNQDIPARVRSNHALEHATLHVLQEKGLTGRLGGISDAGGFFIYGEVPAERVLEAAREGLERLGKGERELAVHPNCGTNLAVGGLAAGGLAWLAMSGTKGKPFKRLTRLPLAVLMGLVGYQVAKPLGPKLQEQITTSADVGRAQIVEVVRHDVMGHTVHRVSTKYSV